MNKAQMNNIQLYYMDLPEASKEPRQSAFKGIFSSQAKDDRYQSAPMDKRYSSKISDDDEFSMLAHNKMLMNSSFMPSQKEEMENLFESR